MAAESRPSTCTVQGLEQQIRLATLTRDENGEIIFTTQTLDLENYAGIYYALSYCWGDRRSIVKVDGKDTEVSQNLIEFIRSFWKYHPELMDRFFWCDAICMDYDRNDRRTFDARYARLIYEKAGNVIAWLGPETETTPLATTFMDKIMEHHAARTKELGSGLAALRNIEPRCPGLLNLKQGVEVPREFPDALFEFLSHDWWARTWIMQESVTEKVIFMWADELRYPRCMFVIASYAQLIFEEMNYQWRANGHSELYEELAMRRTLSNIFARYMFPKELENALKYDLPTSALLLLQPFRKSTTSDVRDKVYAPLSLLDKERSIVFNIDYSLSIEEVYRYTACQLIFSTDPPNLDVLGLCGADPDIASKLILPTWVPDLSIWSRQKPFYKRLGPGDGPVYHADKALKKLFTSADYVQCLDDKLLLKGVLVDTIASLSPKNSIKHQFVMTYDWLPEGHQDEIYFTNETMDLVYRRTLAADVEKDGIVRETLQRGAEVDWAVLADGLNDSQYFTMSTTMIEASAERRLLLSEQGFFGIGPNDLQVGDKLYILLGGQMIYALRKSSGDYRCVGECYVHGWMDGYSDANGEQVQDIALV